MCWVDGGGRVRGDRKEVDGGGGGCLWCPCICVLVYLCAMYLCVWLHDTCVIVRVIVRRVIVRVIVRVVFL